MRPRDARQIGKASGTANEPSIYLSEL